MSVCPATPLLLHHYTKREVLSYSESSFPFDSFGFIFGQCRFSKPEREGTSRTRSRILINRIWKLNMDFGILK